MSTLLLSDLHLPPTASVLRDRFIAFLDGPARRARALYLLGDLFEYWIGDDRGLAVYSVEIRALRRLADSGVALYLQHGNRDFLIGGAFQRVSGVRLLPDPQVIALEGTPTLVTHGDLLCTQDTGYQRWRRFSRRRFVQAAFLGLPKALRERIAGDLRGSSHESSQRKPQDIMDADPEAVREAFRQWGVSRMIHGHTHRPARHEIEVDGRRCERIVLADWRQDLCEYLAVDGASLERRRVS